MSRSPAYHWTTHAATTASMAAAPAAHSTVLRAADARTATPAMNSTGVTQAR
ncbi:hypothetical protein [Actinomadura madurae]|uniref:hypothetical protein n=1 Tax=Actinomadura madurae TaxID=1993 RepID=UPI0020D23DF8|nr:hypothetical protein [Actinomadura madurae]MCQ0015769.1 hypothetical protein [Actinomadura madurae]